jgi:Transposase, Mutator family
MAERPRMTAAQLADKLLADKLLADEHADVLRESVAWMAARLMESDVAARIGAELGERTPDRLTHRNEYRPRTWETRVGQIELAIPRLRQGSYFPSFLEPRRRAEQALVAVVQEAYVNGVSTRKVDRLVEQLGLHHMSKDQVSRLCRGLDEQVRVFRERPLEGAYPSLWLDAKVERVRELGGVRHKALVIAYGVHESGRREVVGLDVGEAETEAFWRAFLRSLRTRGLEGGSSWWFPTPTPAFTPPSRRYSAALGSAAPSTSSGTCSATSAAPNSRWCRARSARSSLLPRPPRHASGSDRSPISSARTRPRSRRCWRTPRPTCWPSTPSRPSTGRSCAPRMKDSRPVWRCRPAGTGLASSVGVVDPGAKSRVVGLGALPRSLPLEGLTVAPQWRRPRPLRSGRHWGLVAGRLGCQPATSWR